jgi:hypothetical protein
MTIEEFRSIATRLAEEMRSTSKLSPDQRRRFIAIRAELFQRGIFDPILARFDTATVSPASTQEVANQLAAIAASVSTL